MKCTIYFFLWLIVGASYAQDTLYLPLYGVDIKLSYHGSDSSGVLLYNMHDNENTSAFAGKIVSKKYGGRYYELHHTGKRLISFAFGKDSIHIDPNRIYTDEGIRQQLKKNKIKDTLVVTKRIAIWRDSVLSVLQLEKRSLVIALHNNTNKEYSCKSYQPGGEYELEAEELYMGCFRDNDDFFFVTDQKIMDKLSEGRYHVILQANKRMTDDGSLSVYCAQRGIPYINVEAQHGHLSRQIKMLIFAFIKLVNETSS
jgi:hypothetical protein